MMRWRNVVRICIVLYVFVATITTATANNKPNILLILSDDHSVPHVGRYSQVGAELLFDVISTAYERSSVIVTTNLPFEEWKEVLGSERLTGATLDRLTHRCTILETGGESYRLRAARRRHRVEVVDSAPGGV